MRPVTGGIAYTGGPVLRRLHVPPGLSRQLRLRLLQHLLLQHLLLRHLLLRHR